MNDVILCEARALKQILSVYAHEALRLGGVGEVIAVFDEVIVEGYDVLVVLEYRDEAGDDLPGIAVEFWERLGIGGVGGGKGLGRTLLDLFLGVDIEESHGVQIGCDVDCVYWGVAGFIYAKGMANSHL